MSAVPPTLSLLFILLTLSPITSSHSPTTCIIGSGIGGASVAHFLRHYSHSGPIHIFERNDVVGGRMATVTIAGDTFEAGASILHPKNYHAVNYTKLLKLKAKSDESDESVSLGIWNGKEFVFKTIEISSRFSIIRSIVGFVNSVRMLVRYGFALFKMNQFVEVTVDSFLKYYQALESRPIFGTVEEMLKWAGLYNLTTRTLHEELTDAGLSSLLIDELATVITRINYGQSVSISGLAGAVSLAGSGGGLWAVEGGNWQMAAGLINRSDVALHMSEEIESISYTRSAYELNSTRGNSYKCDVTVVATPLDELDISFNPVISIPDRKLQHTHATFIRGLWNPAYFGFNYVTDIPELVGTIESSDLPFTCISILKKHSEKDMTYKMFSRQPMTDVLLDQIFSARNETIRIDWGAYPHYHSPEKFAPFMLDDIHLYYVNAFENAASTMETSAVAAENIARLIISRSSSKPLSISSDPATSGSIISELHSDL
ncbi:hypothetical protein DCAR_0626485 [Daucus carota subsp. sativus]|uniref:Prenylcysteine lyase domain-containing protein n=1 Tax=Daucus carota subsp. sativus TaxID=79200 RepID=A0AAF1B572_DAUCS|nr:hypothetical protein DCAR_0626483 [Daucus carota subsp. sativus]WOH07056.1 hypothetical protein DCAR_0626485 [Daucus carota subsp. sativus]